MRDETTGDVTINPGTTADNFCLYVTGIGILTDPDTGYAGPDGIQSNFAFYIIYDSSSEDEQAISYAVYDLVADGEVNGVSGLAITYANGQYTIPDAIELAKSTWFIWTVDEVSNSVLMTW